MTYNDPSYLGRATEASRADFIPGDLMYPDGGAKRRQAAVRVAEALLEVRKATEALVSGDPQHFSPTARNVPEVIRRVDEAQDALDEALAAYEAAR
jgi:hypothetical protein